MRTFLLLATFGAALACTAVQANEVDLAAAQELAKGSDCFSCHAVSEKIVGPAFAKIAEKYVGDKDAVDTLAQSIQFGSKGKWGRAAMPGHSSFNAQELKLLAGWVLASQP